MSSVPTVPMFDPSGQVRQIPVKQYGAAVRAGGQVAFKMLDPKGVARWIRHSSVGAAIKAGGKFDSPSTEQAVQQNTGIHPYTNPVAQGIAGFGRAIKGAVTAPYQMAEAAFAPPTTPEEIGAHAGAGPIGLAVDRMVVQPAKAANKTAADFRASGRPGMAAMAELGAVPVLGPMGVELGNRVAAGDVVGAATEGLTNAVLPKVLKGAPIAADALRNGAGRFRTGVAGSIRGAVRNITETGSDFTAKHASGFENDSNAARAKMKRSDEKTLRARGVIDEANKSASTEHAQKVLKAQKKRAEVVSKHQAETRDALEHNGNVDAANPRVAELDRRIPQAAANYDDRLAQAKRTAVSENDAAWDALREKTTGHTTPLGPIQEAAHNAQSLDPVNGAIFQSVDREEGIPQAVRRVSDADGIPMSESDPGYDENYQRMYGSPPPFDEGAPEVNFNRLHRWNQWLNHRKTGRLEAGQKQAYDIMQDAVERGMGDIAKKAGAEGDWRDAKRSHSQMSEAFRDSPTERSTRATKEVRETAGSNYVKQRDFEKRMQMLRRYDADIPAHAETLRAMREERDTIKPGEYKKHPEPLKPYEEPKPKLKKAYGEPNGSGVLPDAPDITTERRAQMVTKLKKYGMVGTWVTRLVIGGATEAVLKGHGVTALGSDLFMGQVGVSVLSRILRRDSVLDWMAKPTTEDLERINALPPKDAARLRSALTGLADIDRRDTKVASEPIDPRVAAFLAAGPMSGSIPQNAGDAKRRLKAVQQSQ
jgi:hypothetical protein